MQKEMEALCDFRGMKIYQFFVGVNIMCNYFEIVICGMHCNIKKSEKNP